MPGGPDGAPQALTRRITVPDGEDGSRRITVHQAITEHIERTGVRPSLAAHAGGVTGPQVNRWLTAATRYQERADRGRPLTHNETVILNFAHACASAKAKWIGQQLETHRQIAAGGLTTSEVVETVDPLDLDEHGRPRVLSRRVRATRLVPSERAIEWELAHLAREEGFGDRIELTGADGGPIEMESREEREDRLERELIAYQQGLADALPVAQPDDEPA